MAHLMRPYGMNIDHQEKEEEMIDGFYALALSLPGGNTGGGVAVMAKGRVYGGDGSMLYQGRYQIKGHNLACSLLVKSFNGFRRTAFATFEAGGEFHLTGLVEDEMFSLMGRHGGNDENLEIIGTLISRLS